MKILVRILWILFCISFLFSISIIARAQWNNPSQNPYGFYQYGQQSYYGQQQHNYHQRQNVSVILNVNPWIYYYPYAATQIWVWAHYGNIPPNAVAYKYISGNTLYYCRVFLGSGMHNGVFLPGDGCYVQRNDQTELYTEFQVLVTMGY